MSERVSVSLGDLLRLRDDDSQRFQELSERASKKWDIGERQRIKDLADRNLRRASHADLMISRAIGFEEGDQ